ncbi:hypothetical protein [Bordetella muralis]|uniref:hypothetical protein n=1 Tax=Bordetella muralis TaxID=1649130 RepID=UPI0039EE74A0
MNDLVGAMGPLSGHSISNGDSKQACDAQDNLSNHKAGFASRLSSFGWSVIMLPASLFNTVTSNLIAVGNAAVSTLLSVLPEKRTENPDEIRANAAHLAKPRGTPKVTAGLPPQVRDRYNELIWGAKSSGLGLSETFVKAEGRSGSKHVSDLVNVAKKIHAEAEKKEMEWRASPAKPQLSEYGLLRNKAAEFIKEFEK